LFEDVRKNEILFGSFTEICELIESKKGELTDKWVQDVEDS